MDAERCLHSGKTMFSKRDAETKANYYRRRGNEDYMRAYHCPECNAWHITKERRNPNKYAKVHA